MRKIKSLNYDLQKIIVSAGLSSQKFAFNLSSRFKGMHGGGKYGLQTGQSLEFVEHREYQPGDDIRYLDWSAAARSDKLAIKLFKEEITPHVDIFLDMSSSMATYKSKFSSLAALAVLLKNAAFNSGFSYDNWLITDCCRKIEPNSLPIEQWPNFIANYNGDTSKSITSFLPKLRNGGVRILVSDLFWNQEPMTVLNRLSDGAASVIIIQLVTKSDICPDIYGNIRVIDSESGEALELICDEKLLSDYKNNFEHHRQYWKECCSKLGILFNFVVAEELLFDFMPEELIKNEILIVRG